MKICQIIGSIFLLVGTEAGILWVVYNAYVLEAYGFVFIGVMVQGIAFLLLGAMLEWKEDA